MTAPGPCIFGEVLFDHFPDGRRVLGGAPFNVAWHLQAFGRGPLFLSRVGADEEGDAVRRAMADWSMDSSGLQSDPDLPTGRVEVRFENGEPTYDIVYPAAWDAIEATQTEPACRLLYHGTLALRSERSRRTLHHLRSAAGGAFVDVNLREPWWCRGDVLRLVSGANWVKLNAAELEVLADGGDGVEERAAGFLRDYGLEGLIVTLGAEGAILLTAEGELLTASAKQPVELRDTVGAGDAFAAVSLLGIELGWPLPTMLERAMHFASRICAQHGATATDRELYQPFIDGWKL